MSIKDKFSTNSEPIRVGADFRLQAEINDEIYKNLDNYENRLNDTKGNSDNLRAQLSNNEQRVAIIESDRGSEKENIKRINSKISEFDEKIKKFNTDSLDILAEHFKLNYDSLSKDKMFWLVLVFVSFLLLFVSDILLVTKYRLDNLYLLIPVNVVSLSFLYFVVAQYSSYKKLALEYKNREVVAKSYLGVLNNANDHVDKSIITKIVADTLFSRNVTDQGVELPIKEMFKAVDKFR